MSQHTSFKLCLYVIILICFGYILPVTAQPATAAKPQDVLRCGNESISRYEAWVKDLPCDPVRIPSDLSLLESTSIKSLPAPEIEYPDAADYNYLVFSSYRDGNWEIYGYQNPWYDQTIQLPTRMTSDDSSDLRPRLRPGSSQIIFASNRTGDYELYLMDWGGGNFQQLTWHDGYESQAAWSPDGSRLVLVSELDGNLEIVVMLPDGSGWTRLTNDTADDFNPSWSPDGTKLIWVKAYDDYHGVVYTMNADGSNPQALTSPLLYVENPTWSGDGSLIAFDYDANLDYFVDLAWMNADGSNLTMVKGGTYMVDYMLGSWTEVEDNELLFSEITYVEWQGNLYISDMCVGAFSLTMEDGHCYSASELDSYPSAASLDITIPETQVLPLPQYTRSGDFQVSVIGSDPGPAVMYNMNLDDKVDDDGIWDRYYGWLGDGLGTTTYNGIPDSTVFFRSWGWDWADHREPYPVSDYDTFTHVYAWELVGKVMDNRGEALAKTTVVTDPVFYDQQDANLSGKFHRYVPYIDVSVALNKVGYGVLPYIALRNHEYTETDLQDAWVLPPEDNQIQNGDFEANDLSSWTISGDQAVGHYIPGHTGDYSASLCLPVQSTVAENIIDSDSDTSLNSISESHYCSLSQVVSIPSDTHKPTLSFLTNLVGDGTGGEFTVQVNQTIVYSATTLPESWEHIWLDLTEWQSQTITLTFTVNNSDTSDPMRVNLDEISLGSWLTPLVGDVTPRTFEEWSSMVITITGDNFIDTPTVRIGETIYPDVTFLDENILKVEIPLGMAPGIYSVWVINPGGQSGLWREYLKVGELQFLPCLQK